MKYIGILTLFASLLVGLGQIGDAVIKKKPEQAPLTKTGASYSYHISEQIEAGGILFYDLRKEQVIVGKNTNTVVPIASITKLMTTLIALERYNPQEIVTVYNEVGKINGVKAGLKAGERLRLKDLIALSLVGSANDAAMVIANYIGEDLGGKTHSERIRLFTTLMNQRARELNMYHTSYQNPTGLDVNGLAPSNYSTAEDLIQLIKQTMDYPLLWDLSRQSVVSVYSLERNNYTLHNTNKLASSIPNYIGGKTGTTDLALESLVMIFEHPLGHPVVLVLLNMPFGTRIESAQLFLKENHILSYD